MAEHNAIIMNMIGYKGVIKAMPVKVILHAIGETYNFT